MDCSSKAPWMFGENGALSLFSVVSRPCKALDVDTLQMITNINHQSPSDDIRRDACIINVEA